MKDKTIKWIAYAGENLHSAVVLLENGLFKSMPAEYSAVC